MSRGHNVFKFSSRPICIPQTSEEDPVTASTIAQQCASDYVACSQPQRKRLRTKSPSHRHQLVQVVREELLQHFHVLPSKRKHHFEDDAHVYASIQVIWARVVTW